MNPDNNTFILSWDMYGLESCINATQMDREKVWAVLADKPASNINHLLSSLTLRARFNSQRHYEIYAIEAAPEITEELLREQFEQDPQAMAELKIGRAHV